MTTKNTAYYDFTFYDTYVIAEAREGIVINNDIVNETLKVMFDHYKNNNFTVISHRKYNYTVEVDVYGLKMMKKLRALAIVSGDSMVKEKALLEQLAFNQSFAFFEDLEDARGWAESVTFG